MPGFFYLTYMYSGSKLTAATCTWSDRTVRAGKKLSLIPATFQGHRARGQVSVQNVTISRHVSLLFDLECYNLV
jgi:hypothetical protein